MLSKTPPQPKSVISAMATYIKKIFSAFDVKRDVKRDGNIS
jgi:hypothetical protein